MIWLAITAAIADELAPTGISSIGVGVGLGGMLGPSQLSSGFSPAVLGTYEYGAGPARAYVGLHTAPTLLWVAGGAALGAELLVGDVGLSLGSERMRIGPYASIGVLAAGAGVRAAITPFETRRGNQRGLEARLTWYAPRTGAVGLYYVSAHLPRDPDRWVPRRGSPVCDRFVLAVGGVGAVSSTARSWDLLGQDVNSVWTGSPAIAVACESGRRIGWDVGGEMAPLASYRIPTADGGADREVFHMGSISLGAWVGGDRLRVGPIATAGVWALGGGVRMRLTTVESRGVAHGLELRALALAPSAPAGEAWAMYQVWFRPGASE